MPGWCWSATPTSSPRSRRVRCWRTWWPGSAASPTRRCAACAPPIATASEIGAPGRGAARRRRRRGVMAVLRPGATTVELVDPEDEAAMAEFRASVADVAARPARRCRARATRRARSTALDEHRLLCAHREGPYGVGGWNRLVEQLVAERTGVTTYDEWYSGRPVLVTANDYGQRLNNGDMGVTLRRDDGRLRSSCRRAGGVGVRAHPAARRADGARDDRAQVAGLAGRRPSA